MKRLLSVLIVLAGLGILISCKHPSHSSPIPARNTSKQDSVPVQTDYASNQDDPFSRYLSALKAKKPEISLVRFANECGVDVNAVSPRFADLPENDWILVDDLAKGIHGIESDFFVTAEVWHIEDRVLVEIWEMQLDVQNENRTLYCISQSKITQMEFSDWMLPDVSADGKETPGWGYEQHLKVSADGKYERTFKRFEDFSNKPIAEPKMDQKTRNGLNWTPKVRIWKDLKLPEALLH